jgi:beta-1,2-mannobiose phosphorylase / 1,2-beta-oligomannan phosphorylase
MAAPHPTSPILRPLSRLGMIMQGDPANPDEAWGVLNPAVCRDRSGNLLIFPRVVAAGNRSRIGLGRVLFDDGGDPRGVERLGYALEPDAGFERNERTAGVEDPRVTYLSALDRFVMAYTAYGPLGPRIALAESHDATSWRRLGPALFAYEPAYRVDFNLYTNKDAAIFPEPVIAPDGRPALALLHRPTYTVAWWAAGGYDLLPDGIREPRASIWISYCPLDQLGHDPRRLVLWEQHTLLAVPEQPWERLKIGGGTPPLRTPSGWLMVYHGVSGRILEGVDHQPEVRYAAGVMLLDLDDPRRVLYRSPSPVLAPDTADEQVGVVNNVVFPTGIDLRDGGRVDVYYGMADARIGVARMMLRM